ncbi:MAG TPA: DUF3307 domain-containing protein [Candidatus Limnocylindrales bacterium]|nr:DUF3307 domain-containing protein [Candidatus Limnocylindrales bacterium]
MSHPAILLVALALLAHLLADFVFQTDAIAEAKAAPGRRAWRGLGLHAGIVAICLLPFVLAYGIRGLGYLLIVAIAHLLIDRAKIVLSQRAVASAQPVVKAADAPADAPADAATDATDAPGDRAWTPLPAVLFIADQAAHLVVLVGGAGALLFGQPTTSVWNSALNGVAGQLLPVADPLAAVTAIVVLVDLAIINIRGGFFLVGTLLAPRGFTAGSEPGPERVGASIGILERLIVCVLVLAGQAAAIGFVIAAKTLARFRQLDDRHFAEYYLVGTLASVTLALSTSIVAEAAISAATR